MKFTINRASLTAQLNNVLRAISSKTTIPILTGVKIVADPDQIILTGSDADITIETVLAASNEDNGLQVDQPGSIVLPARFFSDIVKKLPDKTVTIDIAEGFQAKITSGDVEFTINGQDAENYPHLPEIEAESTVTLAGDMLKEVIEQTKIAVSTQENRPVLTGIHFTMNDGMLTAVATDSHRLAQRRVSLNGDSSYDVIIPGKSMTELARMISDGNTDVQLQVTDNQVLFSFDNVHFYSRLLEGNYPETSRLIPESADTTLEVNAPAFLAAIDRASLLSHESRNNVIKLTIKPGDNQALISGDSPDVGNVEEEVAADKMDGNDLAISFNPDYMKDALRSFGQAQIQMGFTSALRPFTLSPTEDGQNFVQLITPVRTF